MKIGILGTGKIVKKLLPLLAELDIEKTFLLCTERSQPLADALAAEYGLDGCFTDYDSLLRTEIDTVYVALPNHLHYRYARKALEQGKHVILEKPAVTCAAELQELIRLAKEKQLILLEAITTLYLPAFHSLKEDLKTAGRIRVSVFNFSQYSSRYDAFRSGQTPPVFDPEKCGGALYDINVYNVFAAVALFGRPKGINYSANVERGIDVSGILTLEYDDHRVCCIGAKDCQGDNISAIQAEKHILRIRGPMNGFSRYSICSDAGEEEKSFPVSHRLLPEFWRFMEIIENRDYEAAKQAQAISLVVIEILEQAREQTGIRFPQKMS